MLLKEHLAQALLSLQNADHLEDAQQVLLRSLLVLPRCIVDAIQEQLGQETIVRLARQLIHCGVQADELVDEADFFCLRG